MSASAQPQSMRRRPPPETLFPLLRADIRFIVLVRAVFGAVWPLRPLGALGARAYGVARLASGAGDRHV